MFNLLKIGLTQSYGSYGGYGGYIIHQFIIIFINNFAKLHSGLSDADYLDSNEEDNELEETHLKFEPLTHKSEKDEDYDEDEVDIDQEVKQYFWVTYMTQFSFINLF